MSLTRTSDPYFWDQTVFVGDRCAASRCSAAQSFMVGDVWWEYSGSVSEQIWQVFDARRDKAESLLGERPKTPLPIALIFPTLLFSFFFFTKFSSSISSLLSPWSCPNNEFIYSPLKVVHDPKTNLFTRATVACWKDPLELDGLACTKFKANCFSWDNSFVLFVYAW